MLDKHQMLDYYLVHNDLVDTDLLDNYCCKEMQARKVTQ